LAGGNSAYSDVTTVSYAEIEAKIHRVLASPGARAAEGGRDFSANPGTARANLYHAHFRDDNERLSYALGVFRASLGTGTRGIDQDALYGMLLNYEVQMLRQEVDVVAHEPPTKAEQQRIGDVRAEHERQNYEAYLAEVQRIKAEEARDRILIHSGEYAGGSPNDPLDYYIARPFNAFTQEATRPTATMVSLMINFVPVVGQLKAVAEAAIGRDLITGEEVPTWARGLNLLLAIIPEAKGLFSSGRVGLSTLARVAVESGEPAEEVYQATKVASTLTVEEVQAAQRISADGRVTPAQQGLAAKLEDLPGATPGSRARIFKKTTITGDPTMPAGTGSTNSFGDITYSTQGSPTDIALARNHELVHSFLSPKLALLRNFRAHWGEWAYNKSALLQYIEEALAETYAQLTVRGLGGLPTGIKFPIANGYLRLSSVLKEAAVVGVIGTVVVGGEAYVVYVVTDETAGQPAPPPAPAHPSAKLPHGDTPTGTQNHVPPTKP
jgi:hypothetical protein